MIWLILGALIPSMVVAWAAGFAVRRFGPRWGLVDRPGHRKVHATPMPTGGGLAVWLGIVVPLAAGYAVAALASSRGEEPGASAAGLTALLPALFHTHLAGFVAQSPKLWSILAGATVLLVLGLIDDRRGLDWKLRIGVQTLVALAMVLSGWRMSLFMAAPWLTGALSVVWIVGLINSFNMLDNMDGLSAGVAAIAASMLAVVMLANPSPGTHQPQLFVGGFLLILAGSLGGFLWHNRDPARLFMGDAGAYMIGYLLAVMTLTATFAGEEVPHAIVAPLCVLAVPLYDTTTVVLIRLRQRRSPFVGDKSHFSHRLVELGMTKPQAVATIWLTTAVCGLGALLLYQIRLSGAVIVLAMVGLVLVLIGILETTGRRSRRNDAAPPNAAPANTTPANTTPAETSSPDSNFPPPPGESPAQSES